MSPSADPAAEQIAQRGLQELRRRLQTAIAAQAAQDRSGVVLSSAEIQELVSGAAQRAGAELWRRSLAQAGSELLGIGLAEAIDHPAVRAAHEIVGAPPFDNHTAGGPTAPAPAPPVAPPAHPSLGSAPRVPPPAATPSPLSPPRHPTPFSNQSAAPHAPAAPPPPSDAAPAAHSTSNADDGPSALRVEAVHMGGVDSLRVGERDLEVRLSPDGIDVLKRSTGAPIGHLLWDEVVGVQTPRTRHGLRRVQELHIDTAHGRASFELPGVSEEQLAGELQPLIDQLTGAA